MQRWSVPCALKDKIHSHSLMHLVRSRGEDKIHRLILREKIAGNQRHSNSNSFDFCRFLISTVYKLSMDTYP